MRLSQLLGLLGLMSFGRDAFCHSVASDRRSSAGVFALLAVLACLLPVPAWAQEVTSLGTFGKWSAFAVERGDSAMCYMASEPAASEGKYTKRGEIWALISHHPSNGGRGIVQFVAGYKFGEDAKVEVTIDKTKNFTLFTEKEDAWAYDGDDEKLVLAMKKGRSMVVIGESWRGTKTKDIYSLSGFTKAFRAISKACNAG